MGPAGSYSSGAAMQAAWGIEYGPRTKYQLVYTRTIEEALIEAQTHGAFAVVPIENTNSGLVLDSLHAWRTIHKPNITFLGDFWMPVEHVLMSRYGGEFQILKPEHVEGILTHPQAIAQCSRFLEILGKPVIPTTSTAEAAAKVATDDAFARFGAIASYGAMTTHHLRKLKGCVANRSGNATRFQVLGPITARYNATLGPGLGKVMYEKTAAIITIPNRPAALAELTAAIGYEGIGINAMHALPTGGRYVYDFYIEFECHIHSKRGERIWGSIRDIATDFVLLGSVSAK